MAGPVPVMLSCAQLWLRAPNFIATLLLLAQDPFQDEDVLLLQRLAYLLKYPYMVGLAPVTFSCAQIWLRALNFITTLLLLTLYRWCSSRTLFKTKTSFRFSSLHTYQNILYMTSLLSITAHGWGSCKY